jgi:hypothetical protein
MIDLASRMWSERHFSHGLCGNGFMSSAKTGPAPLVIQRSLVEILPDHTLPAVG